MVTKREDYLFLCCWWCCCCCLVLFCFSVLLFIKPFYCCFSTECQQYQSLTNGNRKSSFGQGAVQCDNSLGPGWFRFEGAAGTRMPTSCVPTHRCDTNVPGWLTGGHPTVADGKVTRKVCFNWNSGCCHFSINIQVRNCGAYYVYYFNSTPNNGQCDFRYCGTDWTTTFLVLRTNILLW